MNGQIFDTVAKCFEEEYGKFLWVEVGEETRIFMQVNMKNSQLLCMSRIREEKNEFVFSAYYEQKVPESQRQNVAEFLTQVNDSLTRGNFEMDRENGEVCFTTSIGGADQPVISSEIRPFIWRSLSTADRYLPGLMAVIKADMPPDQAIALVEGEAVFAALPE